MFYQYFSLDSTYGFQRRISGELWSW